MCRLELQSDFPNFNNREVLFLEEGLNEEVDDGAELSPRSRERGQEFNERLEVGAEVFHRGAEEQR